MQLFGSFPDPGARRALCARLRRRRNLLELVESARGYGSTWKSAQAAGRRRRADQARAGLLPSAG
jgi:hypothetical protein